MDMAKTRETTVATLGALVMWIVFCPQHNIQMQLNTRCGPAETIIV